MIFLEIKVTDFVVLELFSDLLIVLHHNISISLSVAYTYSTKFTTHMHKTQHGILNWGHQEDVAGVPANIFL